MIGIYKITSPIGKIYIGQSIDIEKRFMQYKLLRCKGQNILYRSFLKYGVENHKFEIICTCKISELNYQERFFQDCFSAVGVNGKRYILGDGTCIYIHNTKKQIIVEKL